MTRHVKQMLARRNPIQCDRKSILETAGGWRYKSLSEEDVVDFEVFPKHGLNSSKKQKTPKNPHP